MSFFGGAMSGGVYLPSDIVWCSQSIYNSNEFSLPQRALEVK